MTREPENPSTSKERISVWLDGWLAFHRKWRILTMLAYVTTTVVSIVASTVGGIVAALDASWSSHTAAALAGLTAVTLGIEKALLFREKWRLHLTVVTELEAIKLKLDTAHMEEKIAVEEGTKILRSYGHDLPIGPRDG